MCRKSVSSIQWYRSSIHLAVTATTTTIDVAEAVFCSATTSKKKRTKQWYLVTMGEEYQRQRQQTHFKWQQRFAAPHCQTRTKVSQRSKERRFNCYTMLSSNCITVSVINLLTLFIILINHFFLCRFFYYLIQDKSRSSNNHRIF